jgi:hypothetical protein
VDTEDLVEDPTGTISVAILKAVATTPVAIPTGMTTYGLDIVVKFGAVRRLLWQSRFGPLTFEGSKHFTTEGGNIPSLFTFLRFHTNYGHSGYAGGQGYGGGGGGNVNGFSGGSYGGGNGYGSGGQGGDRMSNLGAGLKQQHWGKSPKSPYRA